MLAFDFSKIDKREARVHSIMNMKVSSVGIPQFLFWFIIGSLALSMGLAYLYGNATGRWHLLPLDPDDLSSVDYIATYLVYGLPIGMSCALYFVKIQNYRLYELLYLLVKPKKEVNINGTGIKHTKVTIDAFLERN